MRLHEVRNVDLPIQEAFDYTADFTNIESWDPGIISSRKITPGPVGEGTKFELEVKFGASVEPMVYEITEYHNPAKVVLVGTGDKLQAVDVIQFEPTENGTSIEYSADLTFFNFLKYLMPVLGPTLRKVGEKALDGLARELGALAEAVER